MDISLEDIRKVNRMLGELYEPWAAWLNQHGISFFFKHTPVLVLTRYGQDEKILRPPRETHDDDEIRLQLEAEQLQNEADQFAAPYKWTSVEWFGFAGAQDSRYAHRSMLRDIYLRIVPRAFFTEATMLNPELLGRRVTVWNAPSGTPDRFSETFQAPLGTRVDVSASQLPPTVYLDEDDTAVDLAVRDETDEEECGVLLRLSHQVRLTDNVVGGDPFGPEHDNEGDYRKRNYTIYPLAFTGRYGNIQAKGFFLSFLQDFPRAVQDLVEAEAGRECGRIAYPINHQGYNEISHKIRTRDGLLDFGRGTVTGALAGEHLGDAQKTTTLKNSLRSKLPFDMFAAKADAAAENYGFRNEAHCNIHVRHLPAHCRNGQ